MEIVIRPRQAGLGLAAVIAFLTAAHVLCGLHLHLAGAGETPLLVRLFHFGQEQNIPAFFQSVLLLFCGGLLFAAGFLRRPDLFYPWLGLGAIFLFLALHEATILDEHLIAVFRDAFGRDGRVRSAWLIPYVVALVPLGLLYLRFLSRLPAATRTLFVVAAGIYLAGVVAMELVGAYHYRPGGPQTVLYEIAKTFEELLEMTGIGVFAVALLRYLAEEYGGGIRFLAR